MVSEVQDYFGSGMPLNGFFSGYWFPPTKKREVLYPSHTRALKKITLDRIFARGSKKLLGRTRLKDEFDYLVLGNPVEKSQ